MLLIYPHRQKSVNFFCVAIDPPNFVGEIGRRPSHPPPLQRLRQPVQPRWQHYLAPPPNVTSSTSGDKAAAPSSSAQHVEIFQSNDLHLDSLELTPYPLIEQPISSIALLDAIPSIYPVDDFDPACDCSHFKIERAITKQFRPRIEGSW